MSDPFQLDTFIAWLEKQDPDKVYVYYKPCACLLAQYFTDQGYRNVDVAPNQVRSSQNGSENFSEVFEYVSLGYRGNTDPDDLEQRWTFGQALERAKAEKEKAKEHVC